MTVVACANLVAAVRRGLVVGRRAKLTCDGGRLDITWQEDDGHVIMHGNTLFSGIMTLRDSKTEGEDMTVSPKVQSFGCRLNIWESEVISRHSEAAGLGDTIIVNTCAVTAEAEK